MANNGYRDGFSNMNNTESSFLKYGGVSVDQRKMNAVRAYFEWVSNHASVKRRLVMTNLTADANSVSHELQENDSCSEMVLMFFSSQVEMDDNLRIWRTFSMGKLLDLVMLDTRNYDRSITTLDYNNDYIYDISNDAGRSLMGSRQENVRTSITMLQHELKVHHSGSIARCPTLLPVGLPGESSATRSSSRGSTLPRGLGLSKTRIMETNGMATWPIVIER